MGKRSIFRILVGIVLLAFGAFLLWGTFQCLHDYLFPKPCCGYTEPKWEAWIFKLPLPLATFFPDIAFILAGVAWIKDSSRKFVWAFIGSLSILTMMLVYDSRISNAILPKMLHALNRAPLNNYGIILGIVLLAFVLFALWKKNIRATLLRKKFLIAAIILSQLAILFGWQRIVPYLYIESRFSAPFFETRITNVIDIKENWGTLQTREVAFEIDDNACDQGKHGLKTFYTFRIPATASVDPVQDDKYLRVKFIGENGNPCSFLLTKISRRGYRFAGMYIHTLNSVHSSALVSKKDFSFFNSAGENVEFIKSLYHKSILFDWDKSDGAYYVYTTGNLSCIKRRTSFDGRWYNQESMIIEIKKENNKDSFTLHDMQIVNNITASIKFIQKPENDTQEN